MAKVPVVLADEEEQIPSAPEVVADQQKPDPQPNGSKNRTLLLWAAVLVIVGLTVAMIMIVMDRNELKDKVNDLSTTQEQGKDETEQLVSQLGKYLELPTDETPTLATVTDVESLKNQQFFKNAQNGDKVLLYSKAGRAILYRPTTKKVVDISTLATQGSDTTKTTN